MIPDQVQTLSHRTEDGSSVPAFAKIVLRNDWYHLQFDDGGNLMRKEYTYATPVNVAYIRARLLDAYGRTVDLMDMDWSFTLELYEVTGQRTRDRILDGVARG
jgi:hypothetical protein